MNGYVPTIYDVQCAIGLADRDECRQAMQRLGIHDVILDTDMIGSVCVGVLDDGTVFMDANDAVLEDAATPKPSLMETLLRMARG